jgi:hypothetical protein
LSSCFFIAALYRRKVEAGIPVLHARRRSWRGIGEHLERGLG